MKKTLLFQIDAFAERPFSGNPAAVCLLEEEADAEWMQAFAAEMNLAETAFVRRLAADRQGERFELRWFTPTVEVSLCGHATLAAAHAIWSDWRSSVFAPIRFFTMSGALTATRRGDLIDLDFPRTSAAACDVPAGLAEALGIGAPIFVGKTAVDDYLIAVDDDAAVRSLSPDFRRLAAIPCRGVMVTAPSADASFDFVSRFFAPAAGIDEDPVTGSAHCALGPYWSERLGKTELVAYQASRRGGTVHVQLENDRVKLSGKAVTIFRGEAAI